MLKRSLVFTSAVALSLKNNQLVVSYKDMPDEKRTIPIEDIGCVIVENQMTTMTMPIINALADANVAVIICDGKSMPNAMVQSFGANITQGETLRNQMSVGEVLKKQLWKQIVEAKIRNQALLLNKLGKNGDKLKPFYMNVKSGDSDNREGIAARLFWQELFGDGFTRDREEPGLNALLNYGYTILRAATARSLVASGLLPAIGLFHHNRSNAFPLADDVMEPYRPYVDEIVYTMYQQGQVTLNQQTKGILINVLYCDTKFEKVMRPLSVGLTMTTASLTKCYAKETTKIVFPSIT